MTAYTPTTWHNDQSPPMSAANLDKMTDELEAQALERGIAHSLPDWTDGSAPAITSDVPWNEIERVLQLVAQDVGLSYSRTVWSEGWTPARNEANLNKIELQLQANRAAIDGTAYGAYWGGRMDGDFYQGCYGSPNNADGGLAGSELANASMARFSNNAGKAPTLVHMGAGGSGLPSATDVTALPGIASRVRNVGAFMLYSFGASAAQLQAMLNAANSATWTLVDNWATAAAAIGHPIMIRPLWEMNGTWYAWGRPGGSGGSVLTAANYRTIWQNLYNRVNAIAPNVSFFWCCNHWFGGSADDPTPFYPGDAFLELAGWDTYWGGKYNTNADSAASRQDQTYAKVLAIAPSKPFAIGEFGAIARLGTNTAAGTQKATYFNDFFGAWVPAHPKLKVIAYFNDNTYEQAPNGTTIADNEDDRGVCFEQDMTPGAQGSPYPAACPVGIGAAQTAFRNQIANPYYAANIVTATTFPSNAKVPVPA